MYIYFVEFIIELYLGRVVASPFMVNEVSCDLHKFPSKERKRTVIKTLNIPTKG